MSARIAIGLVALGLAACAGEHWTYTKPGATPATLDQDLKTCRRQAERPHSFGVTRARRLDQDELNRCMERKGYTGRPDA